MSTFKDFIKEKKIVLFAQAFDAGISLLFFYRKRIMTKRHLKVERLVLLILKFNKCNV